MSDMRHKCINERRKPISEQVGAIQCDIIYVTDGLENLQFINVWLQSNISIMFLTSFI